MVQLSPRLLELRPELIALRRDLHQNPELAYAETRTAAKVAAFLEGSPLDVRTGLARGTGLMASTRGEGRTVLLRVDMDGLPIQEQNEVPYASRVPGAMHACGHDGHVAMGAVAARVLAQEALPGRARVIFQPAEEGDGGARNMVADGVLDDVSLVVGIHLWNEMPVGTLGVKSARSWRPRMRCAS